MYWTTDEEEASSYTYGHPDAMLYRATMRDEFKLLPKKRPTLKALRELYVFADHDSQMIFIGNFCLTDMPESASQADIDRALTKFAHQTSLFDAYVSLYAELFRWDADEFVSAMRALDYDGYIVERGITGGSNRRKHLILWNPRAMRIEEAY